MKRVYLIIFIILVSMAAVKAQELDIVPYLKEIENGDRESAKAHLVELEAKSPSDPSVKFLKGILTENGEESVEIFTDVVKNHPRSRYADASLYRLYSYYYAVGIYETAKGFLTRLKKDYPLSPYIKIAQREIPASNDTVVIPKEQAESKPSQEQNMKPAKYTIQAGAFSSAANAEALKKDFEESGFQCRVAEKTVGGTVFQVVYVGRFSTEEEARSFLQVINSEYKLNGRVVNIPIN